MPRPSQSPIAPSADLLTKPGDALRIAYFVQNPLSARDADRFGILRLAERGAKVVVLDVSAVTFPKIKFGPVQPPARPDFDCHAVESFPALRSLWGRLGPFDLAIALIQAHGISRFNWRIFRMLGRSRTPYLVLSCFHHPGWDTGWMQRRFGERLKYALSHFHEIDPVNSLVARIPPRWLGIEPARFVVHGGAGSVMDNPLVSEATTRIFAHAPDYDHFLRIRHDPPAIENTAVFIDQYSPFHPDLQEYSNQDQLDPDSYFSCLNGLFDRIESELGVPVVIAAHPRADYRATPGIFGGRRIFYGITPDLIARSQLVVAHDSIAVGYAIMFEKPILPIVYRDRYNLNPVASYVYNAFATALGKPYQVLEDWKNIDLSNAFAINTPAYAKYFADFIKTSDPTDGLFWDIVLDSVGASLKPTL